MVRGLFILFIIATALGWSEGFSSDQVTCGKPASESEILKLLSNVKNNILGTVPKFCREDGPAQLAEQVDSGEKELENFVNALKVIGPKEKNTFKVKKEELQESVLVTAKFIILKKMWAQSSEDNQYKVLVSSECGPLGLNRFPIHDKDKKASVKKSEKNAEGAFNKFTKVCKGKKIEDLAPYFSKDVLAETLLNLRKIFPENFPQMVDSLCDGIKNTDEALLKSDEYDVFGTSGKPVSAAKFSVWIKGLYDNYKEIAKDKENAKSEVILSKGYTDSLIESINANFSYEQQQYKELYPIKDDPDAKGNLATKLKYLKQQGLTLEKNDKDIYILKRNAQLKTQKDEYERSVETLNLNLKNVFEIWQKPDAPEVQDKLPSNTAFTIFKDKEGKIRYKISEEDRKIIMEMALKQKKVRDDNTQIVLQDPVQQKIRKLKYDIQELREGDDTLKKTVMKTADGRYKDIEIPYGEADKYYEEISKQYGEDIVPGAYGNPVFVKIDGEYYSVSYTPEIYKNELMWQALKKEKEGSFLNNVLKKNYQNASSNFDKFEKMPEEKIASLQHYTGFGSVRINKCLRENSCSEKDKKFAANIVDIMNKAKIGKTDSQILYRGTGFLPPEILNKLKTNPKNYVIDKGFMSTSADIGVAINFAMKSASTKDLGFVFIIKAKSCIGISRISSVAEEDEFLCPPGMKFNVKKQDSDKEIYILEEVK